MKTAHFPVHKELTDFDFSAIPSFDKVRVQDLARDDYIAIWLAILRLSNPDLGKIHLAIGLGQAAYRQVHKV